MKAVIFNSTQGIIKKEIPLPAMKNNELLLKVQTCGICSSDIKTLTHAREAIQSPIILGHEFTGEIVDISTDNDNFTIGQRVVVSPTIGCGQCYFCKTGNQHHCIHKKKFASDYNGGFAEYVKIPSAAITNGNINLIPESLDYLSATLTEPLACVLNGQENLQINPMTSVAVIGAGPIGLLHAETAKLYGANKIILINKSPSRLLLAKKFNYDAYVDLSNSSTDELLNNHYYQNIGVIIVTVASQAAIQLALQLAAPLGKICLFSGMPKNSAQISLDLNLIHYKQLSLYGTSSSSPYHNQAALNLLANNKINAHKIISHIGTLDKFEECFNFAQTHKGLKVITTPTIEDLQDNLKTFPELHIIN